jgi:hypothetical protein
MWERVIRMTFGKWLGKVKLDSSFPADVSEFVRAYQSGSVKFGRGRLSKKSLESNVNAAYGPDMALKAVSTFELWEARYGEAPATEEAVSVPATPEEEADTFRPF